MFARFGIVAVGVLVRFLTAAPIARDEAIDGTKPAERGDVYGVYNYRTEQLDSGDDPYGWYRNG